jgi:propane monooxygenase reductase subunit
MYSLRVDPLGHTVDVQDGETVLQAALRNGRLLRYGCGHGGCGTCKVRLVDGVVDERVDSFALDSRDRASGMILACSSAPVQDCTIDVSAMELSEEEFLSGDRSTTFRTRIETVDAVCPDIYRLRLALVAPRRMSFVAGQFVNVGVPGTDLTRSYSMANGPADDEAVELYCRIYPGGLFSDYLRTRAKVGDELSCAGPFGQLKLHASHRPILMIGGGSGLAPLLSLLRELAARQVHRPVSLFFGARTPADLYALNEIQELGERIEDFTFVPVLSESWPAEWSGETGLVTDAVAARHGRLAHDVYLCGPPLMIEAATELAIARGARPRNIYFDAFVPAVPVGVGVA